MPATAVALGGGLIGACALWQALALPLWSRDGWEWAAGIGALALSVLCGLAAAWRLAGVLHGGANGPRLGIAATLGKREAGGPCLLALAQAALLFFAAVDVLGLVFDARYRPLPWPGIAAPALLLLALAWLGDRLPAGARQERLLAAVCAVGAVLVAVLEGPANGQALLYAALLLALAAATGWPHRATSSANRSQQRQPGQQHGRRRPARRIEHQAGAGDGQGQQRDGPPAGQQGQQRAGERGQPDPLAGKGLHGQAAQHAGRAVPGRGSAQRP